MPWPHFDAFEPKIRALPDRAPLLKQDLLTDEFRLVREGSVEVFYMPSDEHNVGARLLLVGITPGWTQMELAYRVIRRELRDGAPPALARRRADQECSFAGAMRKNLVSMLDELGLPGLLGIRTASDLFESRTDLVCTTSALKHPVFVNGENFTGHSRQVEQCSFFESCLTELFLPLLSAHSKALIIPLGDFVAQRLTWLSTTGLIDPRRVLFQFPHPSGANGHRKTRFAAARTEMADTVAAWFSSAAS